MSPHSLQSGALSLFHVSQAQQLRNEAMTTAELPRPTWPLTGKLAAVPSPEMSWVVLQGPTAQFSLHVGRLPFFLLT